MVGGDDGKINGTIRGTNRSGSRQRTTHSCPRITFTFSFFWDVYPKFSSCRSLLYILYMKRCHLNPVSNGDFLFFIYSPLKWWQTSPLSVLSRLENPSETPPLSTTQATCWHPICPWCNLPATHPWLQVSVLWRLLPHCTWSPLEASWDGGIASTTESKGWSVTQVDLMEEGYKYKRIKMGIFCHQNN